MSHGGRRPWGEGFEDGWEELRPSVAAVQAAPSPARVYDHLLGGKDHYENDRALAERMLRLQPRLIQAARQNRRFVARAVRSLARAGYAQFLDIGCGLPTADDVHRIAVRERPGVRMVCVDNDPIVLAHARALLAGERNVAVIGADLRDPGRLLQRAGALLDLQRPVAVLLTCVLHFVPDADRPHEAVARLRRGLPDDSALVITHLTADADGAATTAAARLFGAECPCPLVPRTREEIAAFFGDLPPVEPGLVFTAQWRPAHPPRAPEHALMYAGVACPRPLPAPEGRTPSPVPLPRAP